MKAKLLLLATIAYCFTSAQQVSDKQMKSHLKEIEKSKEKGTVIWDLDTVYKAGVPYCIIIEKSHGLGASDYSVRSLQGKELIAVKFAFYTKPGSVGVSINNNVNYYTFYFTDTQNKAEIRYGTKVYKTVAEENLIDGDRINSEEEAKFISLNGTKFSGEENNPSAQVVQQGSNNSNPYNNLVERDRSKMISIVNNQVNQDFKVVGSVQMSQSAENGTIVKTLDVFLTDGTKIAEGKCSGINSHNWSVVTMKDNQSMMVYSSFNNDAIDVVKRLINSYYL